MRFALNFSKCGLRTPRSAERVAYTLGMDETPVAVSFDFVISIIRYLKNLLHSFGDSTKFRIVPLFDIILTTPHNKRNYLLRDRGVWTKLVPKGVDFRMVSGAYERRGPRDTSGPGPPPPTTGTSDTATGRTQGPGRTGHESGCATSSSSSATVWKKWSAIRAKAGRMPSSSSRPSSGISDLYVYHIFFVLAGKLIQACSACFSHPG
ncbi:hypothetical protein BS47DRAFT_1398475 [Hydnum rufescens UP504]|uniref:Uncharacterized protein n=1 Tax=Hydnum rufescens UP504 TaxID=1448309 RepID=A0A9P6AL96_9AGAM|nr:hypothetical protein BS47DRAFT_1398475 [Hydnum rufescens UP504]